MQLDDRFEGHCIDPTITDNAYAIVVGVTAHLDQCPTEQDAKGRPARTKETSAMLEPVQTALNAKARD